MAYAFVQQAENSATASALSIGSTFGGNVTTGNLLIAVCGYSGGDAAVTITDTALNTWTEAEGNPFVGGSGAVGRLRIFYKANVTGAFTVVTATYDALRIDRHLYVAEYSGIATTTPFIDAIYGEAAAPGTGDDLISSGNINFTSQPALSFAWGIDGNASSAPPTAGTGYTSRGTGIKFGGAVDFVRITDKRITATGNNAATYTPVQGSHTYAAIQMGFLEASAGGSSLLKKTRRYL